MNGERSYVVEKRRLLAVWTQPFCLLSICLKKKCRHDFLAMSRAYSRSDFINTDRSMYETWYAYVILYVPCTHRVFLYTPDFDFRFRK